ncbi:MAG: hypothetical protein KAS47_07630 [Candidatus Heimdallarchaeota archaeon]|nr:hypothetical protein [Candidatus Heimdallarchaeota archaeon]
MAEQVSLVQKETSEKALSESFVASLLGTGIVLGYIIACFAALIYVLWLITNIYELLVGLSIFYDLMTYSNIWIGLLIAIGFLAINILALFIILYLVRLIMKLFRKQ